MTSISTVQSTSTIRRKPTTTYKSPSGPSRSPFLPKFPRSSSTSSSSTTTPSPSRTSTISAPSSPSKATITRRHPSTSSSRLPLYHPYGHLALSLPPLDPTAYGLPQLSQQDDSESGNRAAGGRLNRGGRADSQAPSIEGPSGGISSIAAVAAREIKDTDATTKEKASPKKRRAGGGSKRKRKSPEDTDTAYPAKRARVPRGAGSAMVEDANPDADAPAHNQNGSGSDSNEAIEAILPIRNTRSRAKRRDSSETPSDVVIATVREESTDPAQEPSAVPSASPSTTPSVADLDEKPADVPKNHNDKEEGELSDS